MLTLDCIRHGKTLSNQDGRYNGASEESLTREQCVQLAAVNFDSSSYDAVFCSPRKRCVETATHLRVSDWQLEPRIVERNFGVLEGLTQSEPNIQQSSLPFELLINTTLFPAAKVEVSTMLE